MRNARELQNLFVFFWFCLFGYFYEHLNVIFSVFFFFLCSSYTGLLSNEEEEKKQQLCRQEFVVRAWAIKMSTQTFPMSLNQSLSCSSYSLSLSLSLSLSHPFNKSCDFLNSLISLSKNIVLKSQTNPKQNKTKTNHLFLGKWACP